MALLGWLLLTVASYLSSGAYARSLAILTWRRRARGSAFAVRVGVLGLTDLAGRFGRVPCLRGVFDTHHAGETLLSDLFPGRGDLGSQ